MPDSPDCPVNGCKANPDRGTADGGEPMLCHGYGNGTDARCMANWLTIDPEDAGTYAQHIAHEEDRCGTDCPYTVVHDWRRHATQECDQETCRYPHQPPLSPLYGPL